jgi:hypothetical protein
MMLKLYFPAENLLDIHRAPARLKFSLATVIGNVKEM